MVLDSDREPKAAIAQLARALSSARSDTIHCDYVGRADFLREKNFIDLHPAYRTLHVHACDLVTDWLLYAD